MKKKVERPSTKDVAAEIRRVLISREKTLAVVNALVDENSKRMGESFVSLSKSMAADGVNRIDTHAASDIERCLFHSMHFSFLGTHGPTGFVVLNAIADVEEEIKWRQEQHQVAARVDKDGGVKQFAAWLREQGRSDEEVREAELHHWVLSMFSPSSLFFVPQAGLPHIKVNGKKVRVDALVFASHRPSLRVVIECDGFEWHGDKQSFTADRQRDRALKEAGYEVLRYSGPEIWADPAAMGWDLHDKLCALRDAARVNIRMKKPKGGGK